MSYEAMAVVDEDIQMLWDRGRRPSNGGSNPRRIPRGRHLASRRLAEECSPTQQRSRKGPVEKRARRRRGASGDEGRAGRRRRSGWTCAPDWSAAARARASAVLARSCATSTWRSWSPTERRLCWRCARSWRSIKYGPRN